MRRSHAVAAAWGLGCAILGLSLDGAGAEDGRQIEQTAKAPPPVKGGNANAAALEHDANLTEQILGRIARLRDHPGIPPAEAVALAGTVKEMAGGFQIPEKKRQFFDEVFPELEKIVQDAERGGGTMAPGNDPLAYALSGALDGAIASLKLYEPNNPQVWARGGNFYLLEHDYRQAFADYGRALRLGLRNHEVLTGYGTAAYHLGDAALAARSAAEALRMSPDHAGAMALLRLSENRAPQVKLPNALDAVRPPGAAAGAGNASPDEVAAAAQRLANAPAPAAPQSAGLAQDAAAALAVHDYTKARGLATRAIELDARNAQAWNYRAIADNKLGRYADAVYDASFALGLQEGNAAALQTRSWAFGRSGKYRAALADANYSLEKDPANAYAYYNRAFALAGLQDREGSIESLKKAAELDRRFQQTLAEALQAPRDSDLVFLFADVGSRAAARAPAPSPLRTRKRFVRLMLISVLGGVLVALGLLHIFSARWRETLRATVRRMRGAAAEGAAPAQGFWSGYTVTREIGSGGMGIVYEATDHALARRVAIKKMRDEIRCDPDECRHFLSEARTVAALRHPNIVDIYSIVEDSGNIYLVFEYVDGRTVAQLVREKGPLPWAEAGRVIGEACAAVAYAHQQGVIHRDLKLSNIMLCADGRVKVMDFGVARRAQEALNKLARTNTIVGTPPYMAPEAEQGAVRRESDVFALGVCFYEMASAQLPFAGQGAGLLLNKINGRHVPLSRLVAGLPAGADEVVAKALAPDPEKRFRAPGEFSAALQGLQS